MKRQSTVSVMDEWLRRVSEGHKMYCYDLEVKGLNPVWVELVVCSTSVYVALEPEIPFMTTLPRELF